MSHLIEDESDRDMWKATEKPHKAAVAAAKARLAELAEKEKQGVRIVPRPRTEKELSS